MIKFNFFINLQIIPNPKEITIGYPLKMKG